MGELGHQLKRWSLLHTQRGDDAFNLLDMRSFMICQPLGIRMHRSFAWLSGPRHRCHTGPGFGCQRLQHRQQFGTLGSKRLQRRKSNGYHVALRLASNGSSASLRNRCQSNTCFARSAMESAFHCQSGMWAAKKSSNGTTTAWIFCPTMAATVDFPAPLPPSNTMSTGAWRCCVRRAISTRIFWEASAKRCVDCAIVCSSINR